MTYNFRPAATSAAYAFAPPRHAFLFVVLLSIVIGIPFTAYTILTLRHFYALGGFWADSGQLAATIWHGDLPLHTPRMEDGVSFFSTHITLIFLPFVALSYILPLTKEQFFAAFVGLCQALPGVPVYWLLVSGHGMRRPLAMLGAASIATLFAFNGLALAAARSPHFELLIVGSAMLFLVALVEQRFWLAIFFFAVCLLTREDAGLHLFGILVVLMGVERLHGIRWRDQEWALWFAGLGLVYALAALVAQRLLFPQDDPFVRVYLGNPPFHTLSFHQVAIRLFALAIYRAYIVLPAFCTLLWSIRVRNQYLLVGYIAYFPWLVLNLMANNNIAGTLSNYYSFPFIIAMFWPLLGVLLQRYRRGCSGTLREPVVGFLVLVAASFVGVNLQQNPGKIDLPTSFVLAPSLMEQVATDRALRLLAHSRKLGAVLVDGSVAAIVPELYSHRDLLSRDPPLPPDTIIYFVRGYQAGLAGKEARAAGLSRHYLVPGTSIRVVSNRPLHGVAGLVGDAR